MSFKRLKARSTILIGWTRFAIKLKSKLIRFASSRRKRPIDSRSLLWEQSPVQTAGACPTPFFGSLRQRTLFALTVEKTLRTGKSIFYPFVHVVSQISAYFIRVSLNFCVVVCIDCCGVHRSLGTHVTKVSHGRLCFRFSIDFLFRWDHLD